MSFYRDDILPNRNVMENPNFSELLKIALLLFVANMEEAQKKKRLLTI